MHPTLRQRRTRPAHRLVLICLLIALPVYGLAGTLAMMLGARHVHRPVVPAAASAMAGWQDFRRGPALASAAGGAHPHSHSVFQHHVHAPLDASVIVVDGGDAAAAGDAGAAFEAPVLALTALPSLIVPAGLREIWRPTARVLPLGLYADRPERPPRA